MQKQVIFGINFWEDVKIHLTYDAKTVIYVPTKDGVIEDEAT